MKTDNRPIKIVPRRRKINYLDAEKIFAKTPKNKLPKRRKSSILSIKR